MLMFVKLSCVGEVKFKPLQFQPSHRVAFKLAIVSFRHDVINHNFRCLTCTATLIMVHNRTDSTPGACIYRLFLFRIALDKTKNGDQTVIYRFPCFMLSNKIKIQNTVSHVIFRFSYYQTKKTKYKNTY